MTKIAPYHTDTVDYPRDVRNVYHDHNDCPDGESIQSWHRKDGDGKKPHCRVCKKIAKHIS